MVNYLCESYGTLIGEVEGIKYYAFPTLTQLSLACEEDLREAGFGYRAKFIVHTSKQLHGHPHGWLEALRNSPREEAQKNLTTLMGVGQKGIIACTHLYCRMHALALSHARICIILRLL